jgi:hypothetical protein
MDLIVKCNLDFSIVTASPHHREGAESNVCMLMLPQTLTNTSSDARHLSRQNAVIWNWNWNGIVHAWYLWYSKDAWISDMVDLNDLAVRAG